MAYRTIKLGELRAQLSIAVEYARMGDHVIIRRYGRPIVALISMTDLHRIWEDEDYEKFGPKPDGRTRGFRGDIVAEYRHHAKFERRDEARENGTDERWNKYWKWVRGIWESA